MSEHPHDPEDKLLDQTLKEVIGELGYEGSDAFVKDGRDPRSAHLYRLAAKAGVVGTYTLQSSENDGELPRVPVVFVAKARNEEEAREIRRTLWCLGQAPFTIIVLPGQVRAYANSKYDPQKAEVGQIAEWSDHSVTIVAALEAFRAEEIDTGRIWISRSQDIHTEGRVDWHLLISLRGLSKYLRKDLGTKRDVAHALIGKYIYIRYLRDREILTDKWLEKEGLNPDDVLGSSATLNGLRSFVSALDRRFNGSIFPLPMDGPDAPTDTAVSVVARALSGESPGAQQATFDFNLYRFDFIPVETLSVIYEQFLGEKDAQRKAGAFYTPEPVAEYLLAELTTVGRVKPEMTVFDPSCGSGIFLVVLYRQLIERMIAEDGAIPSPERLKVLLTSTVFGVERNLEACYVTEFSLILTLLEYVTPPQLEKQELFKFPDLHDQNIFHCDFFDRNSTFAKHDLKFDWVVGNPPWFELEPNAEEAKPAVKYITEVGTSGCVIKRYRVHEAFMWRAREFVKTTGWIGFIIHATTLTNEESQAFRACFFSHNDVRKVTNFSNFAYRLFPSSQAPAFTVVYRPSQDKQPEPIVHYGPFVADQLLLQELTNKQGTPVISIYETEVRTVDTRLAATGDAKVWKMALWGSYRDEKAFNELKTLFSSSIGKYEKSRGWNLRLGLQLREADCDEPVTYVNELDSIPLLNVKGLRNSSSLFEVTRDSLDAVPKERRYVRTRGGKAGLKVAKGPHIFLTSTFAVYSDMDFVLPHPQVGVSAMKKDSKYLRAVSLLLWSSAIRFLLFFDSPSWGVFTSTFGANAARRLPIPDLTDEQAEVLSKAHLGLVSSRKLDQPKLIDDEGVEAEELVPQIGTSVQNEIDNLVARVLQLPPHLDIAVRDFMQLRYELNKGKRPHEVLKGVHSADLEAYGTVLASELDEFADARHQVDMVIHGKYVACRVTLQAKNNLNDRQIVISDGADSSFDLLWKSLRERHSQWIYVQKSFRQVDAHSVILVKPNRRLDWARSRAYLDSDDIIADLVNEAGLV